MEQFAQWYSIEHTIDVDVIIIVLFTQHNQSVHKV